MANPWPTQYDRRDHMSSTSGAPNPASPWQNTARPDVETVTQSCTCSLCSATRNNGWPVWGTMEYQNPWLPGVGVISSEQRLSYCLLTPNFWKDMNFLPPNQNLGVHNPAGVAPVGGNAQIQPQFVAPQIPDRGAGYAPLHEELQFYQAQVDAELDQAQVLDMSVTETLRRLAVRFVDNPGSIFNVVRLEPGASGRFRVVIVLEVTDIL